MRASAVILSTCLLLFNGSAVAALPSKVEGQALPSLAPMVEKVTPAVVNISTRSRINVRQNPLLSDPFFRHFFNMPQHQQRQSRPQSLGSGVVIDAVEGYVITNHHVIGRADEITVTLRDGREHGCSAHTVHAAPDRPGAQRTSSKCERRI